MHTCTQTAVLLTHTRTHALLLLRVVPGRRGVVMAHVNGVIAKLLSKGLMQFEFAHDLLWEYMQEATPVQMQVSTMKRCCDR